MSFIRRKPPRNSAWVLVVVLVLAYIFAVAHGTVTIDVARDLFWAIEIASARAWPLQGPPVGSFEVLGAIWYYIAATAAWSSSSLTMYFALLGALAALKFVLMYRVALRWLDHRFAIALVVAAALPGVATYQFFGLSHTQCVEVAIWATALFALRMRATPERVGNAAGLGVCAALALHAHPTAVLLLPWAGVAILSLPRANRIRVLTVAVVAATMVFLPRIFAFAATNSMAETASGLAENIPGTSGLGGSIAGLWPIAQNLFWFQPRRVVETVFTEAFAATIWPLFWSLLLLTLVGAAIAAVDRQLRATLFAAVLTVAGVLIAITLLRDHTPFYMLYVALPPLAVVYALTWSALCRARGGFVVYCSIVAAALALHVAIAAGYVQIARNGFVLSRLPLHSNMQDTGTTTHAESVSAAPTRDAVAKWLCSQPSSVALHGDIAATFDIGLAQEQFFHCHHRKFIPAVGGHENAWTGLPLPVWRQLATKPEVVLGSYGLLPAHQVVSPSSPLPSVSGRAYPPRFSLMIAAARHAPWQVQVETKPDALIVVSSLLPTYPLFSVTAIADGMAQPFVARFANTAVFRCASCKSAQIAWSISIQAAAPETTSITVLYAPVSAASGFAKSSRLAP